MNVILIMDTYTLFVLAAGLSALQDEKFALGVDLVLDRLLELVLLVGISKTGMVRVVSLALHLHRLFVVDRAVKGHEGF